MLNASRTRNEMNENKFLDSDMKLKEIEAKFKDRQVTKEQVLEKNRLEAATLTEKVFIIFYIYIYILDTRNSINKSRYL